MAEFFELPPQEFGLADPHDRLALALGATLYCPADRSDLVADVARGVAHGATSMVFCLEDAIASGDVAHAEANLVDALGVLADGPREHLPLLFIRVRNTTDIEDLARRLGVGVGLLAGMVLPKFTPTHGLDMLEAVEAAGQLVGRPLFSMPVLETPDLLWAEKRVDTMAELSRLFRKFRSQVLALRIGATDLCGLYGLRRARGTTVYEIGVVAALIADVVNVFARPTEGWRIAGPVCEYYDDDATLRRETHLDRQNGLVGKSTIHPAQVAVVNAASVVSAEDYADAVEILGRAHPTGGPGGVFAGAAGDRMNEPAPHVRWARDTLSRADVFGVVRPGVDPVTLAAAVRSSA